MSGPDGIQAVPPAGWKQALFYRQPTDDCCVLENLGNGRGRVVAHPTYGAQTVIFTGDYGHAWARWLQLGGSAG